MSDYDPTTFVEITPRGCAFSLHVAPRFVEQYVKNEYERATSRLLRNILSEADLFIDVGAHYGYFTLLAHEVNPTIQTIAIEPIQETYRSLTENLERNAVERARTLHSAIGGSVGTALIHKADHSDNSGLFRHPNAQVISQIPVNLTTIDALLSDAPLGKTIVVKVDAEGAELEVLRGSLETFKRIDDLRLVLEINPKMSPEVGYGSLEIIQFLSQNGFSVFGIDERTESFLPLEVEFNRLRLDAEQAKSYYNVYCVKTVRKLSVLLFSHTAGLDGAERSLADLARGLVARGAICNVVVPCPGNLTAHLQDLGVGTIELPFSTQDRTSWWWAAEKKKGTGKAWDGMLRVSDYVMSTLVPELKMYAVDVVFSQTIVSPWGAYCAQVMGRPHITSICEYGDRDHDLHFTLGFVESRRALLESSRALVSITSDTLVHFLNELGPTAPNLETRVVYRSVKVPRKTITDARKDPILSSPSERIVVSIFGRVHESKGQIDLVRAAALLRTEFPEVVFRIIGDSAGPGTPYVDEILSIIETNQLEGRVSFVGHVTDPYELFGESDLVVSCSRNEALGRTLMEASHFGCAIVYPFSGGPAEIFKDKIHGVGYVPGNPKDLARAIRSILENPDQARIWGTNAKQLVEDQYNDTRFVGGIFGLMEDLKKEPSVVALGVGVAALISEWATVQPAQSNYKSKLYFADLTEGFAESRTIAGPESIFGPFDLTFDLAGREAYKLRFDPIEGLFVQLEIFQVTIEMADGTQVHVDIGNLQGNWKYSKPPLFRFLTLDPIVLLPELMSAATKIKIVGRIVPQTTSWIASELLKNDRFVERYRGQLDQARRERLDQIQTQLKSSFFRLRQEEVMLIDCLKTLSLYDQRYELLSERFEDLTRVESRMKGVESGLTDLVPLISGEQQKLQELVSESLRGVNENFTSAVANQGQVILTQLNGNIDRNFRLMAEECDLVRQVVATLSQKQSQERSEKLAMHNALADLGQEIKTIAEQGLVERGALQDIIQSLQEDKRRFELVLDELQKEKRDAEARAEALRIEKLELERSWRYRLGRTLLAPATWVGGLFRKEKRV